LYDLIDPISAVTWLPRDERAFICLTGGIPRAGWVIVPWLFALRAYLSMAMFACRRSLVNVCSAMAKGRCSGRVRPGYC